MQHVLEVRVSSVLGMITDGRRGFEVKGTSLREVLENLFRIEPRLRVHILDDAGALRQHILIFLDDRDARWSGGLDAETQDTTTVTVLQAVSGG